VERSLFPLPPIVGPHHITTGKVEKETELLIMFKTRSELMEEIVKVVRENHSYEVPEVISHPLEQGNPAYLSWISENTKKKAE